MKLSKCRGLLYCIVISAFVLCACQSQKGTDETNVGIFDISKIESAPLSEPQQEDQHIVISDSFNSTDGSVEFIFDISQSISNANVPVVQVQPHFLTEEDVKKVATALWGDADYYEARPLLNAEYSVDEIRAKIERWAEYSSSTALYELYGRQQDNVEDLVKSFIKEYTIKCETASDKSPKHEAEWQFRKASYYDRTEDKINAVYAMGEYFALQGNGTNYEAQTVILATGVSTAKAYPGEEQFLGRGVSYCATCDAPLYRGKTAAIIGFSPKEEAEADFMAEMADKVYYIPMYEADVNVADSVEVLREKPVSVEGSLKVQELVTDRNRYDVDGVFFLRESVSPAQLVPGLKIEDNHIAVDRQMRTNLAGCFACGDAVGAPYQYIKSAGEGNVAALSAVAYLAEKKRQSK